MRLPFQTFMPILLLLSFAACTSKEIEPPAPEYSQGNFSITISGDTSMSLNGTCEIKYVFERSFSVYFFDSNEIINSAFDVAADLTKHENKPIELDSNYQEKARLPYFLNQFLAFKGKKYFAKSGRLAIKEFTENQVRLELQNHLVVDTVSGKRLVLNGDFFAARE